MKQQNLVKLISRAVGVPEMRSPDGYEAAYVMCDHMVLAVSVSVTSRKMSVLVVPRSILLKGKHGNPLRKMSDRCLHTL